jgi:hypothetical protein
VVVCFEEKFIKFLCFELGKRETKRRIPSPTSPKTSFSAQTQHTRKKERETERIQSLLLDSTIYIYIYI